MLSRRKYTKNNRGQALVEFALVVPVLLLLLVAIMELGLVINHYITLTEAAREGARSAALGGSNVTVAAVAKAAASHMDASQLTVSISPESTRIRGNGVTVTVEAPVQIITKLMSPFFPPGFTMQGAATMRVE